MTAAKNEIELKTKRTGPEKIWKIKLNRFRTPRSIKALNAPAAPYFANWNRAKDLRPISPAVHIAKLAKRKNPIITAAAVNKFNSHCGSLIFSRIGSDSNPKAKPTIETRK